MNRTENKLAERFRSFRQSPPFVGFVLFCLVMIINIALQGPDKFFTASSIGLLFEKNAPFMLITMAQAMLMLLGIIDISLGIQISFVNVICIMLPQEFGVPVALAWCIAVLAAIGLSMINGFFVSYMRIPPLLSSFAMVYIVKGLNVIIMSKPQGMVPAVIWQTYSRRFLGIIPMPFFVIFFVYCVWLYLKKTSYMNHVYAVGGNERNAFASGVNPAKVKMKTFILAGFITGLAGLCFTAMRASGDPLAGEQYGLQSIAACILGGIALNGGWGTMSCALFGGGFLVLIQNSIYYLFQTLSATIPGFSASTYWQNLVSDGIILLGLVATVFTSKTQKANLKEGLKKITKGGDKIESE